MQYYPFIKNWRKIKPHLNNKSVQEALVRDMNKFTMGRWQKPFTEGMLPEEVESCDWRWSGERRGRMPEYWKYVKHAACHWLVNFNLELAKLVEPNKEWRIITSQKHSCVWDGESTLFDFSFSALGVSPDESFKLANKRMLLVGKQLLVHYAEDYRIDKENRKKKLSLQKVL